MSVMRTSRRRAVAASAIAVAALTLGTLSVHPAAAAGPAAEGVIQYAGAPNAVQGSYIVTLDESAADSDASSGKAVAAKYGAKIKKTYTAALNGYAVSLSEAQAKKLAADPAVESVVQDRVFTIQGTQPNPTWGLDRIDQRSLPLDRSYTYPDPGGEGVTAYVIDTGVRITHSDFGGRASYGYDAVDNDNTAQDGHGHGTHVAGTVAGGAYGVAKKAKIVAVRVLDNNGSGTTAGVVAGIDWVTRNAVKPAVANMSLGGGADSTLDAAVRNSIASGVTYAVAAGNENTNASTKSPARVTEAITVGSTTNTDARSSFSNYGSVVDIFAPGSSITSAWNNSDTATSTISGTSMASPHVAGAAALYLANNPSATPDQVATALTSSATTGVVTNPGTGSPNRLLYVGDGGTTPPPGDRFENTADFPINDLATVESPVTVTGVSGNAPSALKVEVNILHTYIGDLRVQLVAPDGTAYLLKDYGTGGSADNINTTYTVDASSEAANGTWKLRVTDNYRYDTGRIDAWALQF
ncbi:MULTISPECIES: S8 family peptidase [Streptomyces]|jgi:Subtilisin-like serine proteases|uniref:Extracellular serine proteinase n=3 Tax=Streptomyces TaxID=1883 RepID=A0A1D8G5Z3_9ACTN|nr:MULTISPECIES: S8 family peptidase [Streptomyces]AOT60847.1 Extracellular serine proteinase precursor [Streptomyces rubrolavendulae]OSY51736.1 Extracellular serine proteinase precursor [Streptomyces fradiae ATCC 10745 = DSM 40063]QEV13924.1 S8 family peptidase [Streptomyces fradiae ATCC 10745 = DSM 40063]UQS30846.1 S8 family peptidase [Streptomyces fradiae]